MNRDPDRSGVVRDRTGDRLTDPPCSVSAELITSAVFILINRPHQTGITFLNYIEKAQAAISILLSDRHHQPKISTGKRSLVIFISGKNYICCVKSFVEMFWRLHNQLFQASQFLLYRLDIFFGNIFVHPLRNYLLQLMHFLANTAKFIHHRLNTTGPQAKFLQQSCDLTPVTVHALQRFFFLR